MTAFLYILENKQESHYIGITGLRLEKRLERHNQGDVRSTTKGKPWHVVYFEKFNTLKEARELEKKIKSWHGGNAFKSFLARAAGSSNGRTWAFEAQYLGSSPSPAALAGNRTHKFGGMK